MSDHSSHHSWYTCYCLQEHYSSLLFLSIPIFFLFSHYVLNVVTLNIITSTYGYCKPCHCASVWCMSLLGNVENIVLGIVIVLQSSTYFSIYFFQLAYYSVYVLRKMFDLFSGYAWGKLWGTLDERKWLRRIVFLETVAGVPGMVGAMVRHLRSLRHMDRDHGWIHTLLGVCVCVCVCVCCTSFFIYMLY